MGNYSTKNVSQDLLAEIREALKDLHFGSIELYVQNGEVIQITRRQIKKLNNFLTKTKS